MLGELVEFEDHDLWEILSGRRAIADPRWQSLIQRLLEVRYGAYFIGVFGNPCSPLK